MKVLFVSRSTLFTSAGGDTVQILKTAESLRALGVSVDVNITGSDIDTDGYDIIHLFNMIRPADGLSCFKNGKVPVVLSTIYVDYSEYERRCGSSLLVRLLPRDLKEYLKVVARRILNGEKIADLSYLFLGHHRAIQKICRESRMLLPNSKSEYERVCADYNVATPYRLVPNAIDPALFSMNCEPNSRYQDAVVCVARIEGRKNQLNLIKALNGAPYQVFIIGKCSPNHQKYLEHCKAIAAENIHFIDHVDHEELPSIYAAAKVHALASWFETTGLCSLEAAVMGCNLVVTAKGDQREYFDGYAAFCEPDDIESIRAAVDSAWQAPKQDAFRKVILERYTWARTAEETLAAYQTVLEHD